MRASSSTNMPKNKGLQPSRYIISKANGNQMDPTAEYFVLRLDKGGEPSHVNACKQALAVYAAEIEATLPELASDLRQQYNLPETHVLPI